MVLECGGNGRAAFSPPARGNQWANGGAGCAEWTGVRLADVLKDCRPEADGEIHRALCGRPASSGNPEYAEPLARRAHREGDGCRTH
jgi:DMSO/TMAO reductase YedYZ molybdopterin-dependent catalytic subunit